MNKSDLVEHISPRAPKFPSRLAHEQKGARAVYNKAECREQRKEMLQDWANMIDSWTKAK